MSEQSVSPEIVTAPPRPQRLAARLRGVAFGGGVVIFGLMGGFTVWAATAPLASIA